MSQTQNKVQSTEQTLTEQSVKIALTSTGKNLTGTQLKNKLANDKAKELRKATNEAQKVATQTAKDAERTLSFQYKRLQKFAQNYCVSLSLETGKDVSFESIKALKFADFTPYITERETSVFFGNWSFPRFLTIIKRYYRSEAKNTLSAEQVAELSAIVDEINAD
jgi:hypothetical protein